MVREQSAVYKHFLQQRRDWWMKCGWIAVISLIVLNPQLWYVAIFPVLESSGLIGYLVRLHVMLGSTVIGILTLMYALFVFILLVRQAKGYSVAGLPAQRIDIHSCHRAFVRVFRVEMLSVLLVSILPPSICLVFLFGSQEGPVPEPWHVLELLTVGLVLLQLIVAVVWTECSVGIVAAHLNKWTGEVVFRIFWCGGMLAVPIYVMLLLSINFIDHDYRITVPLLVAAFLIVYTLFWILFYRRNLKTPADASWCDDHDAEEDTADA